MTSSIECQSVWEPCVFSCHYQLTTGKYSVLGETLHFFDWSVKANWAVRLVQETAQSPPKTTFIFKKHTGFRYLSTAFKKASISSSFPHNPASNDKAGSRKQWGPVRVCSSRLPILRGQRREITIIDTSLEQQWPSDKTTLYTPLVNQSRSPNALFGSMLKWV